MIEGIILIIATILLPPLGVFFVAGCGVDLVVNILLTCLGYLPGHIHAFYLEYVYYKNRSNARNGIPSSSPAPGIYSGKVQRGGYSRNAYPAPQPSVGKTSGSFTSGSVTNAPVGGGNLAGGPLAGGYTGHVPMPGESYGAGGYGTSGAGTGGVNGYQAGTGTGGVQHGVTGNGSGFVPVQGPPVIQPVVQQPVRGGTYGTM